MTTSVFFHERFIEGDWPIIGNRYRNFKDILDDVSQRDNVSLFRSEPIAEDELLKVHTEEMLEAQKRAWYYEGARTAVGGLVQASGKVWSGEIDNAVVFDVAAGHHAGRNRAWGGTYLSCIGPAVLRLKELGAKRLAYFDTDCHHGDGARDILKDDDDVLHLCFCSSDRREGSNVCFDIGWQVSDREYLNRVEEGIQIAEEFKPEMILHFFGHDTHKDDYGSRGLSDDFFVELAKRMEEFASKVCDGKYVVVDGGGANAKVTEYIFPRIIDVLRS